MKGLFLFSVLFFTSFSIKYNYAQTMASPSSEKKEIDELRLKLNKDGSHFLKATILNQIWLRYTENNPETTALGDIAAETFDIGLRRTRLQLYGQITDHVFFYFQFGQNNVNYLAGQNATNSGNRKNQVFFHDALGEYRVFKNSDRLHIGAGLTITNGLSRFSQPSSSTILSLDVPVFAQPTVDQTDEFSRKLSIYARGQLGRLDYRIVASDPFPITSNGQTLPAISPVNATFSYHNHHKQYQALLIWNFLDKESHITPYMIGTYLGKKTILNVEAGFISQSQATWTGTNTNPDPTSDPLRKYYDMNLWSVALFYDSPINAEKGTAINAYVGYFNTDYGTRYLRYNGSMNPANSSAVAAQTVPIGGFGNSFPMFGTGSVIYAQLGYLLNTNLLGHDHGALMPYITYQRAVYERLNKSMNVIDMGINWLIKGYNSKLTLDYQLRPIYSQIGNELNRNNEMKTQLVLQYQFFF